jgi:bifunctional DNA-binding transcriptional regulator/antitoxin component of YhaV-PrlF toxin-antitoxin module
MNTIIVRLDSRGRVYVPKTLRTVAGLDHTDFVKIGFKGGSVTMQKVLLIEQGNVSPKARAELTRASIRMMSGDEIRDLAKYIIELEETK